MNDNIRNAMKTKNVTQMRLKTDRKKYGVSGTI